MGIDDVPLTVCNNDDLHYLEIVEDKDSRFSKCLSYRVKWNAAAFHDESS